MLLDNICNEVALCFGSEIINQESFDLEVDFPLSQKIVLKGDDYHICGRMQWSNTLQQFVRA